MSESGRTGFVNPVDEVLASCPTTKRKDPRTVGDARIVIHLQFRRSQLVGPLQTHPEAVLIPLHLPEPE